MPYKKPKTFVLTFKRKFGRALARGSKTSMARECLKNQQTKRYIMPQIGIKKEMKVMVMASDAVDSIMRGQSIKSAMIFSWKKVIAKLEAFTPPSRSCAKGGNPKHRLFRIQLEVLQRHPHHQKATLLPLAEAIATSSYPCYSHFCT